SAQCQISGLHPLNGNLWIYLVDFPFWGFYPIPLPLAPHNITHQRPRKPYMAFRTSSCHGERELFATVGTSLHHGMQACDRRDVSAPETIDGLKSVAYNDNPSARTCHLRKSLLHPVRVLCFINEQEVKRFNRKIELDSPPNLIVQIKGRL